MKFLRTQKFLAMAKLLSIFCFAACTGSTELVAARTGSPQVKVDGNGNIVTIWEENIGGNLSIQSSTKAKTDSDWSTPVTISTPSVQSYSPMIAMDSAGNVIALWIFENEGIRNLASAQLPFGGSWSAVSTVSVEDSVVIDHVRLEIDAPGDVAVAMWKACDLGSLTCAIYAATTSIGGTWSDPLSVSGL